MGECPGCGRVGVCWLVPVRAPVSFSKATIEPYASFVDSETPRARIAQSERSWAVTSNPDRGTDEYFFLSGCSSTTTSLCDPASNAYECGGVQPSKVFDEEEGCGYKWRCDRDCDQCYNGQCDHCDNGQCNFWVPPSIWDSPTWNPSSAPSPSPSSIAPSSALGSLRDSSSATENATTLARSGPCHGPGAESCAA